MVLTIGKYADKTASSCHHGSKLMADWSGSQFEALSSTAVRSRRRL
jgi:hypothetical protein